MTRMILAILLSMAALASPANAWWNKDWTYRKAVTVDTSPTGVNLSGPVGRTLVLVRLHSGNFTFTDALENGADIRLVDTDDKTPLPYHIEHYDASTGIAALWVQVPNINGGEKRQLWLYFGNKTAPAGADAKASFDPDYIAAYHFADKPGEPAADATANANTAANAPPGIDDGGIIGRAARFAGQGELTIAEAPSLAMPAGAPLSITGWIKADRLDGEQAIFSRGPMVVGISAGVPFVSVGEARIQASAPLKQGDWSHLGVISDGKTLKLYVNGIEAAAASTTLPALAGPISIGGGMGRAFVGEIDELRLSKTARPANMLVTMAQAEGPSAKLVNVSDSAEKQSSGGGTFLFVLSKVEMVDGVIIGLCMILLTIATSVMVSKSRFLNRTGRANQSFMKRFNALHEQLASMKAMPEISPAEMAFMAKGQLYHLYETGIDEIDVRRKVHGVRPLTGQAVEAMRATLDAIVVEENQKLDKWMVMLTIAISGGPFIGLLGTVMGVMNTFGGVALAGDVNVNAIAPGIAAALMATIAGLACAIPSLFGYNYLNSRISETADEMRVFVDRLITRLAEMQADLTPSPRIAAE